MSEEKRELVICRGLQGSGKSTFAQKYISEAPTTRTRINRDTIRHNYYNSYWGEGVDEDSVTLIELSIAATIMTQHKRDIVVDNTGLKEESVIPYLRLAEIWGYEVRFEDFEVDLDELIRRDGIRDKPVTEAVIRMYHDKYLVDGKLPPVPTLP